jgi:hypothetical protein
VNTALKKTFIHDQKISFLQEAIEAVASLSRRAHKEDWRCLYACFSLIELMLAQQMTEELLKLNREH